MAFDPQPDAPLPRPIKSKQHVLMNYEKELKTSIWKQIEHCQLLLAEETFRDDPQYNRRINKKVKKLMKIFISI